MTLYLDKPPKRKKKEIFYPEGDGKPMAETDVHRTILSSLIVDPLNQHFKDDPNIYITGNLFIYYVEGNPRKVVAPDVFVSKGVGNYQRRIYKVWEEGKSPDFVIELTSSSTAGADRGKKRILYERLGVQEYFIFDPLKDYLEPRLVGFKLDGAFYTAVSPVKLPDGELKIFSEVLNFWLQTDGNMLRLVDPETGEYLRDLTEAESALTEAESALSEAETALSVKNVALEKAANENAVLSAEIERLRALLEQSRD